MRHSLLCGWTRSSRRGSNQASWTLLRKAWMANKDPSRQGGVEQWQDGDVDMLHAQPRDRLLKHLRCCSTTGQLRLCVREQREEGSDQRTYWRRGCLAERAPPRDAQAIPYCIPRSRRWPPNHIVPLRPASVIILQFKAIVGWFPVKLYSSLANWNYDYPKSYF